LRGYFRKVFWYKKGIPAFFTPLLLLKIGIVYYLQNVRGHSGAFRGYGHDNN